MVEAGAALYLELYMDLPFMTEEEARTLLELMGPDYVSKFKLSPMQTSAFNITVRAAWQDLRRGLDSPRKTMAFTRRNRILVGAKGLAAASCVEETAIARAYREAVDKREQQHETSTHD